MLNVLGARMGDSWSLLVGRTTYENFAHVWPKRPPNPFTEALNNVQKFVVSSTQTESLPWQNSTLLKGDSPLIGEFVLQIQPLVLGKVAAYSRMAARSRT